MTANIELHGDVKFWGDGGPRPIERDLYQTLNLLLHCGPRMDPGHPLPRAMKLEELIICVIYVEDPDDDEEMRTHVRDTFSEIYHAVETLQQTGLLWGLVDAVEVHDRGLNLPRVIVHRSEAPSVPAHWDRYGFEWGIEGRVSTEQS